MNSVGCKFVCSGFQPSINCIIVWLTATAGLLIIADKSDSGVFIGIKVDSWWLFLRPIAPCFVFGAMLRVKMACLNKVIVTVVEIGNAMYFWLSYRSLKYQIPIQVWNYFFKPATFAHLRVMKCNFLFEKHRSSVQDKTRTYMGPAVFHLTTFDRFQ